MTSNLSAPLVEGINWSGDRRHYLLSSKVASHGGPLGDHFSSEQALCGAYAQSRDVFERRHPNKQFDQVPLCAHCNRSAGNQQVAGRPTLEQAVAAVKPLFISAGLVDADAEDYAYDAARTIMRLYGDEAES